MTEYRAKHMNTELSIGDNETLDEVTVKNSQTTLKPEILIFVHAPKIVKQASLYT